MNKNLNDVWKEFKLYQKVFYVIGIGSGVLNIGFWIIMGALNNYYNFDEPFFNKDFHRRVYKWGIFIFLLIIAFILFLIYLSFIDL